MMRLQLKRDTARNSSDTILEVEKGPRQPAIFGKLRSEKSMITEKNRADMRAG